MTKSKCDKCGKETEGKTFTEDGYRLLVLCPECEKRHNEFVRDLMSRTAFGQTMGVAHVRTNVTVQAADLTGHDGETLVIRPHESPEWRKTAKGTAYWMRHEANNYWACSQCGRAAISTGYGQDRSEYCPRCGRRMVL